MKKAIIFDFDGTLVNTLDDLMDSVNYGLMKSNLPIRSYDEIKSFVGNGIYNLVLKSVPKNTSLEVLNEAYENFKKYYELHKTDKTVPYDGIIDLLIELKKRGFLIGIASNKYNEAVNLISRKLFGQLIDVCVGEMEGLKRKPAPDIIYKSLELLDVDAKDCYYVGDSEVDYQTVVNANIDGIFVSWGFRDRKILEELGAKIIIDKPDELLGLI